MILLLKAASLAKVRYRGIRIAQRRHTGKTLYKLKKCSQPSLYNFSSITRFIDKMRFDFFSYSLTRNTDCEKDFNQ